MCKTVRYIQRLEIKSQYEKSYISVLVKLPKEQYYSFKLSVSDVNSE